MKLHLPKMLLGAVLAVCATAHAATGWNSNTFYVGGTGTSGIDRNGVGTVSESNGEITITSIDASGKNGITFWADGTDNSGVQSLIETISTPANITISITKPSWGPRYFDSLLIEELNVEGNGKVNFDIAYDDGSHENKVVINEIHGKVGSVSVSARNHLTIGTAESTTTFGGTITNNGTMTVNGAIAVTNLSNFDVAQEGSLSWSDTSNNQGFQIRNGATYKLATGGVNFGTTTQISVDGTLTDITTTTDGTTTFTGGTVTGTVYYVTNADVTAGAEGTAGATGYDVASGRTLYVNADSGNLGDLTLRDGSTFSISNASHAFSASGAATNVVIGDKGTVSISSQANGGNSCIKGTVQINAGGKLILGGQDSLGWNNSIDTLTLTGAKENEAVVSYAFRETLKTDINMQGYARFQNTGNGAIEYFGGTITASGKNNTIEGNLMVRGASNNSDSTITVADGGELTITGNLTANTGDYGNAGDLTKTGTGKLIIQGENSQTHVALNLSEGALEFSHGLKVIQVGNYSGSVTTAADTSLILGGSIVNSGAGSVILEGDVVINNNKQGGYEVFSADTTGFSDGDNGFRSMTDIKYYLVKGGTVNVENLGDVTIGETETAIQLESVEGGLVFAGEDTVASDFYYVNTEVTYGGESGTNNVPAFKLNGGTLNMTSSLDTAVVTGGIIGVADTTSTLNLAAGVEVYNSNVTKEEGSTINLTGSGTYNVNSTSMNVTVGDKDNWTGKVILDSVRDLTGQSVQNWGNANSTIEFKDVMGHLSQGATFNSKVVFTTVNFAALELNNGYADCTYTFQNEVSGNGNFIINKELSNAMTINFAGDTSKWVGKMEVVAGTHNVKYTGTTSVANSTIQTRDDAGATMNLTIENNTAAVAVGSTIAKNNGTVNMTVNAAQGATFSKAVTVSSTTLGTGTTAEFNGTTDLGALTLGAGATVTGSGNLTLSSLSIDLTTYTTSYDQPIDLVSTTGTLNFTGSLDNYLQISVGEGKYTASITQTENALTLNFTANPPQGGLLTTTVTDYELLGGVLTLTVGDPMADYSEFNIIGFADGLLDRLRAEAGLPANGMVTLQLTDGSIESPVVGTDTLNVGFYGAYYGENVGGAWQYNVAYIPEPTTATLSLLALCGLAARRRRASR